PASDHYSHVPHIGFGAGCADQVSDAVGERSVDSQLEHDFGVRDHSFIHSVGEFAKKGVQSIARVITRETRTQRRSDLFLNDVSHNHGHVRDLVRIIWTDWGLLRDWLGESQTRLTNTDLARTCDVPLGVVCPDEAKGAVGNSVIDSPLEVSVAAWKKRNSRG